TDDFSGVACRLQCVETGTRSKLFPTLEHVDQQQARISRSNKAKSCRAANYEGVLVFRWCFRTVLRKPGQRRYGATRPLPFALFDELQLLEGPRCTALPAGVERAGQVFAALRAVPGATAGGAVFEAMDQFATAP